SSERVAAPASRRIRSVSLAKASLSSCIGSTPAWRSTALLSQRRPNISRSAPTASWRTGSGIAASDVPSAKTSAARTTPPAAAPKKRGAPTTHDADGEHDGERLYEFDERGEKRSEH